VGLRVVSLGVLPSFVAFRRRCMSRREHANPFAVVERRFRHFDIPPCLKCGSVWVSVHDRTVDALILDCPSCEDRWMVLKPSVEAASETQVPN
jgi:hypothetical protein